MLWTDDVDNIDCGISYYQMGYMVCYATQRPLYLVEARRRRDARCLTSPSPTRRCPRTARPSP